MLLLCANPRPTVNLGFRLNFAGTTMFARAVNSVHAVDRRPDAILRRFRCSKARHPLGLSERHGWPARRELRALVLPSCHRAPEASVFAAFRPHRQPTRDLPAAARSHPRLAGEWP